MNEDDIIWIKKWLQQDYDTSFINQDKPNFYRWYTRKVRTTIKTMTEPNNDLRIVHAWEDKLYELIRQNHVDSHELLFELLKDVPEVAK